MFGKKVCWVVLVLMLGLIGNAGAANVAWNGEVDSSWGTPGNWATGALPTTADTAVINGVPGPIVDSNDYHVDIIWVGQSSEAALTVDGGTLTTTKWVIVGITTGSNSTVNMRSGTFTVNSTLLLGDRGEAVAHLNLDGGVLNVGNLEMRRGATTVATMDVQGGTLIVNGDARATLQGYIDKGWITFYDGYGTYEIDYNERNDNKTTLTAESFLKPSPSNGGMAPSGDTELSWTLLESLVDGEPVLVDVYISDDYDALWNFTDPESMRVVTKENTTSVVVKTQPKTRYYWAIDSYIGDPNDPILGPIFSFTADNMPPDVDAGADVVSWLVDGVRMRNLDAMVTDDGEVAPYTVTWTVVSEPDDPNSPDAVIADPTAEDTSVTMSAVGKYVLQLEAHDGEKTGSDQITIYVYTDPVEATKTLPDYQPLLGDLNGDCKVDELDLALLQENMGMDITITDEVELD